jgi:hypothetical protein
MKKLLVGVFSYIAFLLAPTGASAATIVVPYTVQLPAVAALPPLILDTASVQQFDPALGTLNDVQVTLTGPFRWIAQISTNTLSLTLEFGSTKILTPNFPPGGGFEMVNLMQTLTSPFQLQDFIGTTSMNGLLIFNWGGGTQPSNDVISQSGVMDLQGTVTYDYTPAVTAVPEPATWAMMLLGFAGLGFAFRQSRRKASMA